MILIHKIVIFLSIFQSIKIVVCNGRKACSVPPEADSGIIFKHIGNTAEQIIEEVTHENRILIMCKNLRVRTNTEKTVQCMDGLFYQDGNIVDLNNLCKRNCVLPGNTIGTKKSNNCYKWHFGGEECTVLCGNEEKARFQCSNGQLEEYDVDGEMVQNSGIPLCDKCSNTIPSVDGGAIINCERGNRICYYRCDSEHIFENIKTLTFYQGQTASSIECKNDLWSQPKCNRKCSVLPIIRKGFYVNSNCREGQQTEETLCEYSCFPGYLPGSSATKITTDHFERSFIECKDGEWKTLPLCRQTTAKCADIENVEGVNAVITECTTEVDKSICHFECKDGFSVVSPKGNRNIFYDRKTSPYSGVIYCVNDVWEKAVCDAICPKLRPVPHVRFFNEECETGADNSDCMFFCDQGYVVDPSFPRRVTREGVVYGILTCSNLRWNDPICKPAISSLPSPPRQINFCKLPAMDLMHITINENCRKQQIERGAFCSFTCKSGFFDDTALDSFISQCVDNSWANEPKNNNNIGLLSGDMLRCNEKCRPLNVDGKFNLQQNCLNNVEYNHGKSCTVNCITGLLLPVNVRFLRLKCQNGAWTHSENLPLSFELKCADSLAAIPPQPSVPEICPSFSTDNQLKKNCQMVNGKEECIVWCPFGEIKYYNKMNLRLVCERGIWMVSYLTQNNNYEAIPFNSPLECSKFCRAPVRKTDILYSTNCLSDAPVFSQQTCEIICANGAFQGLMISKITVMCNDGMWMKLRDSETGFQAINMETLVCPTSRYSNVCQRLPSLTNGRLNGKSCTPNALEDTICSFSCIRGYVANPLNIHDCDKHEGAILCKNSVWQTPSCYSEEDGNVKVSGDSFEKQCKTNNCGNFPDVKNGFYVGIDPIGDRIPQKQQFKCNQGYINFANRSEIQCINKTWDVPVCLRHGTAESSLLQLNITINLVEYQNTGRLSNVRDDEIIKNDTHDANVTRDIDGFTAVFDQSKSIAMLIIALLAL